MLKTLMGIGSGQPSFNTWTDSTYTDASKVLSSYGGLLQEISKHNTYNVGSYDEVVFREPSHIATRKADAGNVVRSFYDTEDQPSHMNEERTAEWLIEALNVPNKLGWPVKPVLPMRKLVNKENVLSFGMMIDINMEAKVMSISKEVLKSCGKQAIAFKDAEDTTHRFVMLASEQIFTDRVIPFVYYSRYAPHTDNTGVIEIWIAPKDLSPQTDGWQLHIHESVESIKQTEIKTYRL